MNHVIAICIAYEQGVGKGRRISVDTNPYEPNTDENEAWDYGYSEGHDWFVKRVEQSEDKP